MNLSKDQLLEIKKQLIQQIESSFPEDKKESAIQEIKNMNDEKLINFLKQNNLIKETNQQNQECIFCSMVFGDIPTTKIAEDKDAIAVLEINPISKGHTLIIPKQHIFKKEQVLKKTENLSKEIKKILKEKLRPKKILTSFSELFQHGIINLIPVYKDENLNSPRKKVTKEELNKIHKLLTGDKFSQSQKKKKTKKETINRKNTWLPMRIP